MDGDVLALGRRIDRRQARAVSYIRGSAHRVPFPDGRFTHVVCRVALNSMHQASALAEMARVLEPGGYLYCQFEGPGYDLRQLGRSRTWRGRLGGLRSLVPGGWLAASGRQAMAGGRPVGGRAFGHTCRIARVLRGFGCRVLREQRRPGGFGLSAGYEILAQKGKA